LVNFLYCSYYEFDFLESIVGTGVSWKENVFFNQKLYPGHSRISNCPG